MAPHPYRLHALAITATLIALPCAALAQQPRAPVRPTARADAGLSPAETARRAQPVARVGGVTITVGEFEDLLNEAPPQIREAYADPARRREYLEQIVATHLLADEARRRGLDRDPQVSQSIRQILRQRVEQTVILEAITPESVTDEEVRQWYQSHLTDYQQPEYRRATAVIAADRETAQRVIDEARRARGDMRRVRDLVRQHSVDEESKRNEGDLFYFQRTGAPSGERAAVPAPLAAAVFALTREMDVTAQPVALAEGRFGVAVLTGIRPEMRRALDSPGVTASIREFIVRERRREREERMLADLRARLRPEVHEDRLELVRLPPSDLGSLPPFIPPPGASPPPPRPNAAPRDGAP
jgi:peptidyl-prolyl cis-trans isomerase C